MRASRLVVLAVVGASCAHLRSPSPPAPAQPAAWTFALDDTIGTDTTTVRGVLPNGLTYMIRRNAMPPGRAELRLVVNAGSVLEDEDQRGLAHFVEHMAFNGTQHFAKHQLTDFLESIGMRFGPDLNAFTSSDETVYMLQVPTDSAQILDKAFLILRDWAVGMLLEDEEIEKERGVILEEWRLGRGAQARIRDAQRPVVYHGSRYASRPPIGDPEVIAHCPPEALRRFYRTWYRPDLMAVIAVGDFEPEAIRRLIAAHFQDIPPHPAPAPRVDFPVPDHPGPLCVVATDPEATRTTVTLYHKVDPRPSRTWADCRMLLVERLCLGMLNTRLEERTRELDPPFVSAFASKWSLARTKDSYTLSATVREGGLRRGLEALVGELARLRQAGFTQTELDRQRRVVLRTLEREYEEREKTDSGSLVWRYVDEFLTHDRQPEPDAALSFARQHLPTVSLHEVNQLVSSWGQANRVIAVGAPDAARDWLPPESELLALVDSLEQTALQAYLDSLPTQDLMARRPTPGRVRRQRRLDAVGAVEWTLSNGVRVVVKPTDFKNDEILFSAFSPGGHSLVPDSLIVPALTACDLVVEGGVGQLSRTQLDKLLAGSLVTVQPTLMEAFEGFWGSCSPRDLEKALQLVHLYFTSPRIDSATFLSYRARQEEVVRRRSADPFEVFQDTLSATLNQYDPRQPLWNLELLDRLDPVQSLAVYQDRFGDASDFTFVLVGSLDLGQTKQLVETYLGSLPAPRRTETWRDVAPKRPSGVVAKEVRRGVEPKSHVTLVFPSAFSWSAPTVHRIRSTVTALQIRLRDRIREEMGGTYGVGVWPSLTRYPREECLTRISFGCDPHRVEELVEAVFAEIRSLQEQGPDSLLLTKVKEGQRRQFERNLRENQFWLNALYQAYVNGQPAEEILEYPKLVDSLSAEDIRRQATALFSQDRYVRVVLYPSEHPDEPLSPQGLGSGPGTEAPERLSPDTAAMPMPEG